MPAKLTGAEGRGARVVLTDLVQADAGDAATSGAGGLTAVKVRLRGLAP